MVRTKSLMLVCMTSSSVFSTAVSSISLTESHIDGSVVCIFCFGGHLQICFWFLVLIKFCSLWSVQLVSGEVVFDIL